MKKERTESEGVKTVTAIRIDAEIPLYNDILDVQNQIRVRIGRKVSLAAVIKAILRQGLTMSNNVAETILDEFYKSGVVPIGYAGRNRKFTLRKASLDDRERRLKQKESDLEQIESILTEKEAILNGITNDHFANRDKLFDLEMQVSSKDFEIDRLKHKVESLEGKLQSANEKIEKLKNKVDYYRQASFHQNQSTGSFWEIIKPFIPLIAALGLYLISNKLNTNNLPPELQNLAPILDKMTPEQKARLGEMILELEKKAEQI